MEKAIEIKRRAQRCIQNGDLDGALTEYEKLVTTEDSDPYNYVLLADLLFKRGAPTDAVKRYLAAVGAYEKAGLYKNAIAVCKKMMRLSLAPAMVLERLGALHALDGLSTEATLYYVQYAEHLVREDRPKEAVDALRRAFEACHDEVKVLERLSEVHVLAGDTSAAAKTMAEAAHHWSRLAMKDKAEKARGRAEKMQPGSVARFETESKNGDGAPDGPPKLGRAPDLGMVDFDDDSRRGPPALPLDDADSMATPVAGGDDEVAGPPRLGASLDVESTRDRMFGAVPAEPEPEVAPPTLSGDSPGLRFAPPGLDDPAPPAPPALDVVPVGGEVEPEELAAPAPEPAPSTHSLGDIERLLAAAQEKFRSGDRSGAGDMLVDAAQAYEDVGKLDNAASIYRSLCRSPQSSPALMELWLGNCERRDDRREAAEVACELGDRALQDGDTGAARGWFERACEFDQNNAVAQRRLARLAQMAAGEAVATAAAGPAPLPMSAPAAAAPDHEEAGRVEYAVGRGEAVTFDLGSLLSEFQRGIEAQLSGDAQSHYDLAMTYREMGLLEQAVESFRLASGDPAFAHRAWEMIGRCLLDQGRFDDAAHEFAAALDAPDLDPDSSINLRYQLGLSLEAAGRLPEALTEFERVFAAQASFPDVALKLRVLRKSLGNG